MVGLTLGSLLVGFVAGQWSSPRAGSGHSPLARLLPVQAQTLPGQQAPNDPRELIPLVPGPGEGPGPGQQSGEGQQPGQAPGPGECPVLLYKDGQFYQIQPGPGQPGQPNPGGGENGNGTPGGDNELIPLQPYNGPSPVPGLPVNPEPLRI